MRRLGDILQDPRKERESSVEREVDEEEVVGEATDDLRQRQKDCQRSSSGFAHGIALVQSSEEKYSKSSFTTLT